jgi:hypothetical protein
MAGRRRLLLADITVSKARGKDLIKAIGAMNGDEKGSMYQTKGLPNEKRPKK